MDNGTTIGSAYVQILPSMEGIKGRLTSAFSGEGESAGNSFGKSFSSKAGAFLSGAAKTMAAGITAGAGAVAALTKSAVESYAEYEQLVGGVETLFGAQGMSLEDYAESVGKTTGEVKEQYDSLMSAQNTVMKDAAEAYKTAGLSANEYMETVTSFSASLIQSLGGDTEAAAQYANMAIVDMSDNANKMGTDMAAIQNAYNGFAKQNYTMLDNLKLGYGGTKSEMERLVADAEKLNGSFHAQRDEAGNLTLSYADVVDAIHIVQENMGITGTTAKEASTTISGSIGSMKAAWSNLVTGLASDNADIEGLVDNLVTTIIGENGEGGVINNILPAIERALDGIVKLVAEIAPKLIPMATDIIIQNLPMLIEAGTSIIAALVTGLIEALPQIIESIPEIVMAMVNAFAENWPAMKEAGIKLLTMIGEGVSSAWSLLTSKVEEIMSGVKQSLSDKWNEIKADSVGLWEEIVSSVTGKIETVKKNISDKFEEIKSTLSGIVEKIKGLFNFSWSFPKPKMPHFTVEWKDLGLISIPNVTVEWYKKAYGNPYMFTEPTVMGFGDGIGGEIVYGHDNLMRDIQDATSYGDQSAMTDVLEQLAELLDDLKRNGLVARAYLDRKEITDTVAAQMRRNQRAGGYA